MAIDNPNIIDGMAYDEESQAVVLLLTDHLSWKHTKETNVLKESDHLVLLQDKINAYISFLESGQYMENFSDKEIKMAVIEIHFKYDISENCEKFLDVVQEQTGQYGIMIKAKIG